MIRWMRNEDNGDGQKCVDRGGLLRATSYRCVLSDFSRRFADHGRSVGKLGILCPARIVNTVRYRRAEASPRAEEEWEVASEIHLVITEECGETLRSVGGSSLGPAKAACDHDPIERQAWAVILVINCSHSVMQAHHQTRGATYDSLRIHMHYNLMP